MKTQTVYKAAAAAILASTLVACGGGSGDAAAPQAPPTTQESPAGIYSGTTSQNRNFSLLVLDTGRFYALYGPVGDTEGFISGVVVGDGAASGTSFTSSRLQDFDLELGISGAGSLSSTFTSKGPISGSVSYPASGQTATFNGTYEADYDLTPSLAIVAGTYNGSVASPAGDETATLTVTSAGQLTATSSGGCNVSGTVEPRTSGNVYNVTATFGAGCLFNGQTFNGHAVASENVLYAILPSADITTGVLFVGEK